MDITIETPEYPQDFTRWLCARIIEQAVHDLKAYPRRISAIHRGKRLRKREQQKRAEEADQDYRTAIAFIASERFRWMGEHAGLEDIDHARQALRPVIRKARAAYYQHQPTAPRGSTGLPELQPANG